MPNTPSWNSNTPVVSISSWVTQGPEGSADIQEKRPVLVALDEPSFLDNPPFLDEEGGDPELKVVEGGVSGQESVWNMEQTRKQLQYPGQRWTPNSGGQGYARQILNGPDVVAAYDDLVGVRDGWRDVEDVVVVSTGDPRDKNHCDFLDVEQDLGLSARADGESVYKAVLGYYGHEVGEDFNMDEESFARVLDPDHRDFTVEQRFVVPSGHQLEPEILANYDGPTEQRSYRKRDLIVVSESQEEQTGPDRAYARFEKDSFPTADEVHEKGNPLVVVFRDDTSQPADEKTRATLADYRDNGVRAVQMDPAKIANMPQSQKDNMVNLVETGSVDIHGDLGFQKQLAGIQEDRQKEYTRSMESARPSSRSAREDQQAVAL